MILDTDLNPMIGHPILELPGFRFHELFHAEGLERLDQRFLSMLQTSHPSLHQILVDYRQKKIHLSPEQLSEFLIECAKILEIFLAQLFNIEEALAQSEARTVSFNPISSFKKYYILRRAKKELNKAALMPSFAILNDWLTEQLKKAPLQTKDPELAIALLGLHYLATPDQYEEEINKLVQWCTQAFLSPQGQEKVKNWTSFKIPEKHDLLHLLTPLSLQSDREQRFVAAESTWRYRDGFKLTDPRMSQRAIQDEVNYCIYCHDHNGDFCSKGFPQKKNYPELGFKKNALDNTLTGCPLEEKISEAHFLKKEGLNLASLAMIMVDNPLCPATGHRICNDCMKACIYQKQTPVNIPQIETGILTDILALPWGVEIYDLLTRWNPLRQQQWVMKPYNGLKIMIAGMGPAGFTLAHHLLLEGFAVTGFDGLKIEPLPAKLIKEPIYHFNDLKESLDERLIAGFGGVAEYGITVRWDKNFLKLIYLSLARRPFFQVFGGVRFGGTITVDDAWKMGFDHLAIAVGAGLPHALSIPGSLAPGMRQANDFLMALQLGHAARMDTLSSLQIRLPVVVIGGGLTGVDTATEAQAYYIAQVEKTLWRYEILMAAYGEEFILNKLDSAARHILDEFLEHGRAIRAERERARLVQVPPDFIKLLHAWGGVTIAYRRSMQESPAYIHNHEELIKAMEEGIFYREALEPSLLRCDPYGFAEVLVCHQRVADSFKTWTTTTEEVKLPARTVLVATGTQPNTAYEFEHRGTFHRIHLQYQCYEEEEKNLHPVTEMNHCKQEKFGPFTSYQEQTHRVSLVGDTHPVFHGSVVKAIASGLRTYPKIMELFKDKLNQRGDEKEYSQFANQLTQLFQTRILSLVRKKEDILELTVHAPLASQKFQAGQFYRLQNFETDAPTIHQTLMQMEPLALTAAACDPVQGHLTFLIHETTVASKLCGLLKPGMAISLMGPTGIAAKIPHQPETILIIDNQNNFSFLRAYGHALRQAGSRVMYVSQYTSPTDIYDQEKIEEAADMIIWTTPSQEFLPRIREQDRNIFGKNVLHALLDYATQSNESYSLNAVNRIYVLGNTDLLRSFQAARTTVLAPYLSQNPKILGAVYGNMQCMLKGVCAQCLQWQIDPITGERSKAVFACSWQNQPLELIDIDHIDERAHQNSLNEKLNQLWVDHLLCTQ